MPCRVLIVEDDPMARQLLHMIIDRAEGYRVAKTIESAILADVCCSGGGIDLVIMDIRTALQANGLDAAEKLIFDPEIPKDGYYAFYCEKCAPGFLYHGRFAAGEELKLRAEALYKQAAEKE